MIVVTFIWPGARWTVEHYYSEHVAANAADYAMRYNGAQAALRGDYRACDRRAVVA